MTAEKAAENAVARSKGETDTLQGRCTRCIYFYKFSNKIIDAVSVQLTEVQVRKIRATRKGAKAATREARAAERAEEVLQKQVGTEPSRSPDRHHCLP